MFGKKDDEQAGGQAQAANQVQSGAPVVTAASPAEPKPDATLEEKPVAKAAAPASPPPVPPSKPPQTAPANDSSPALSIPSPSPIGSDDLIDLKQDALQQLSPLISHLDQDPEERFRTTMMLIQATDDSSKIKDAYEAAQKITDEKVRAQALLDIVNEINYFTQQNKDSK